MSDKQESRMKQILELLSKEKKMDVSVLANKLDVSQVTVRKDLDALESKGFIRRIHGYAELNDSDHISSRLAYHYEEKKKIAGLASELVHDGDTIMIESGSCCTILADILAARCQNLTIITNSTFIAEYIRDHKNVQVILLGGIYQQDSQCLVGPMIRENADNYHVNYFFIGTDGWSEHSGFSNKDQLRAQAVRDMAHACDEVVVLTESEKFNTAGTVPLNLKNGSIRLITDDKLSPEIKDALKNRGINIM